MITAVVRKWRRDASHPEVLDADLGPAGPDRSRSMTSRTRVG